MSAETVYAARCSCDQWAMTGTATELDRPVRAHDDSPRHRHVVSIAPCGRERDADFEAARFAALAAGLSGLSPQEGRDDV